jgi:acylphosphatase
MKVQAHVIVSGLVQGVFFRSTCRDEARQVGVTGWVRNLENDRVEAVFEGEKDAVSKMVQWCNKGPPGARVNLVDVEWGEYTGRFNSFNITY